MMTYETAKKLVDAGFPIEKRLELDGYAPVGWCLEGSTLYRFPSLEELVTAIGGERIISAIKRNELYRFTVEDFAALWLKDNA